MLCREWGNGSWGLLLGIVKGLLYKGSIPTFPTKHQGKDVRWSLLEFGFRVHGVDSSVSGLRVGSFLGSSWDLGCRVWDFWV